jgi:hypothetical protein
MEKLNCSAGDLAIAIKAHNPSNIGSIVKVLRKHPNQYIIPDEIGQFIWMVEGSHLLTYTKGGRTYRQKRGAVPDSYLKPIKGQPSNDQLVTGHPDKSKTSRNRSGRKVKLHRCLMPRSWINLSLRTLRSVKNPIAADWTSKSEAAPKEAALKGGVGVWWGSIGAVVLQYERFC